MSTTATLRTALTEIRDLEGFGRGINAPPTEKYEEFVQACEQASTMSPANRRYYLAGYLRGRADAHEIETIVALIDNALR